MVSRANQVWETSEFTGPGNATTLVAVVKSFYLAYGTGGLDRFNYFIRNRAVPGEHEEGTGHLSDAQTLVRDTVTGSSNGGLAVNFSSGVKDITSDYSVNDLYDKPAVDAAIEVATSREVTGASATLQLSDRGQVIYMISASAQTLTIPTNADVAIDIDSVVHVIREGAGTVTFQGDTGVTVNDVSAGSGVIQTRYQGLSLIKKGTNKWIASGDIGTVS